MKTCARAGCPELLERGQAYCAAHQPDRREADRRIKAASEWRWVYKSRRWLGLRREVLAEQPWCAAPGCFELAHDIDHIVPLQDGGDPFDRAGLQGLCASHHSAKTREEVRERALRRDAVR